MPIEFRTSVGNHFVTYVNNYWKKTSHHLKVLRFQIPWFFNEKSKLILPVTRQVIGCLGLKKSMRHINKTNRTLLSNDFIVSPTVVKPQLFYKNIGTHIIQIGNCWNSSSLIFPLLLEFQVIFTKAKAIRCGKKINKVLLSNYFTSSTTVSKT